MAELRLEELNATNVVAANNLSLKPGQEQFLAPVTYAAETAVVNPATTETDIDTILDTMA